MALSTHFISKDHPREGFETINRYSDMADRYRFRWNYSQEAIAAIFKYAQLNDLSTVADIGAGTGMVSEWFVEQVARVFAIEPNTAMRQAATEHLGRFTSFRAINGKSDQTSLPDRSIDLIAVGRALHWFPPAETVAEFRRILKPGGWLAILQTPSVESELAKAHYAIQTVENGWNVKGSRNNLDALPLSQYFGHDEFLRLQFPQARYEDWETFWGRLCSFPSAPKPESNGYQQYNIAARALFDRFAENAVVVVNYTTDLYLGEVEAPFRVNGVTLQTELPQISFAQSEVEGSVVTRFEKVADAIPEQLAVVSIHTSLTYHQLNQEANRLAHTLLQLDDTNEPIALLLNHDVSVLVAMLGVLKAGRTFVVLDLLAPNDRLHRFLQELNRPLLISNQHLAAQARGLLSESNQLLVLETISHSPNTHNLQLAISPDAPSAITFTSGSTGTPKGVVKSHRSILHKAWLSAKEDHLQVGDRVGLLQSCNFGAAIADTWGGILNGSTIVFYDVNEQGLAGLAAWIEKEAITTLHIPTELYRQLLDRLQDNKPLTTLRIVAPSGRIYHRDVERSWNHLPPDCIITSRFSSSETGRAIRMEITRSTVLDGNIVPVGHPLDGVEVSLHNEDGTIVTPGEAGQIWIRSCYLPIGYWRNPELTQRIYQVDPNDKNIRTCRTGDWGRLRPDGFYEFLGRKDARIKVRGYRIDLNEVEAAIFSLPLIRSATVTVHKLAEDHSAIVAYYVPAMNTAPTVSDLRRELSKSLPAYMIPAIFVSLPALPMTANGRVNFAALPVPPQGGYWQRPHLTVAYLAPRTELEKQLAEIWSEVLAISPIGVADHFLDLGGDSLRAMQIHTRVCRWLHVEIPQRTLFDHPTIAEMSTAILTHQINLLHENEVENLLAMLDVQSV